jgi:hypothetical protein
MKRVAKMQFNVKHDFETNRSFYIMRRKIKTGPFNGFFDGSNILAGLQTNPVFL